MTHPNVKAAIDNHLSALFPDPSIVEYHDTSKNKWIEDLTARSDRDRVHVFLKFGDASRYGEDLDGFVSRIEEGDIYVAVFVGAGDGDDDLDPVVEQVLESFEATQIGVVDIIDDASTGPTGSAGGPHAWVGQQVSIGYRYFFKRSS